METYFLLIVSILILLAVSDLIVGVSNDAVNFLNSAIGSKAAPFKIIMIIAALGILFGATFSSGMMEVARKGIFHPDQFFFPEIMIIFLAVMMTDIILLDFFNTMGLPTSTTVSIVFELLGAAVAVSLIKIRASAEATSTMSQYINTSSAMIIIAGILLSVVVAFTVGMIIQYLVRILFSFNYQKTIRNFGALWGGIAISTITYFILIKGAKGSSFMEADTVAWIKENTGLILLASFAGWTVLLQLMHWVLRLNILKMVVLVGTFALAMAFAGNDLVNFIGVPLAGLDSFLHVFHGESAVDPAGFTMTALTEKVQTPTLFLLIAGLIMVLALWTSKKARSVTATEINLGRQDEGYERFESSAVARGIVRGSVGLAIATNKIIHPVLRRFIAGRFNQQDFANQKKDAGLSFDLVRASVNLVVASALISFATSLKLPLSTTYVTFMVAMGTSLADGAWGRDSAVYRVSGVVTVIGGWFFTAFSAFTAAFLIAFLIHWGGIYAILGLLAVAIFFFFKTHRLHRSRDEAQKKAEELTIIGEEIVNGENVFKSCNKNIYKTLSSLAILYSNSITTLSELKRKNAKRNLKEIKELNKEIKILKNNIHKTVVKLQDHDIDTGHFYVQSLDYLRETAHCLNYIAEPVFEYIDNNHPPLSEDQKAELSDYAGEVNLFFSNIIQIIKGADYESLDDVFNSQNELLEELNKIKKRQLKRIKKQEVGTKNSLLYLGMMNETKNLILYCVNLLKAQRDFVIYNKSANNNEVKEDRTEST
jgi:phosphate/sulfate permease